MPGKVEHKYIHTPINDIYTYTHHWAKQPLLLNRFYFKIKIVEGSHEM